jgi:hypothetical protein
MDGETLGRVTEYDEVLDVASRFLVFRDKVSAMLFAREMSRPEDEQEGVCMYVCVNNGRDYTLEVVLFM